MVQTEPWEGSDRTLRRFRQNTDCLRKSEVVCDRCTSCFKTWKPLKQWLYWGMCRGGLPCVLAAGLRAQASGWQGQGRRPRGQLESRLKCSENPHIAAMRNIITWTWPSLYDGNNTFSREQSFYQFQKNDKWHTHPKNDKCHTPRAYGLAHEEYLWYLCPEGNTDKSLQTPHHIPHIHFSSTNITAISSYLSNHHDITCVPQEIPLEINKCLTS